LRHEEKLEILEVLRRGNLSHHEIAKRFNRAQSTVSKIARDASITPTHRRKRSGAAKDPETTYGKEQRIAFQDRFIGVLEDMVESGGLTPKDVREVAQAAKVVLDARRSEDVEPDEDEKSQQSQTLVPLEGMGEMMADPNTDVGREMLKLEAQLLQGRDPWKERWAQEKAEREAERQEAGDE
jgi:hypothetical protein